MASISTFGIDNFHLNGYDIPLPYLSLMKNIATQLILTMNENLLPKSVKLIQVTPQGGFVTQLRFQAVGIILAVPIVVMELVGFVGPALYQGEKAIIVLFTIGPIFLLHCYIMYSRFLVKIWNVNWG